MKNRILLIFLLINLIGSYLFAQKQTKEVKVDGVELFEVADTLVYNFTVEENHDYYVSGVRILVHNVSILSGDKILRSEGRDVIVVETSEGPVGFYRSTGENSGKPGEWFPFDGVIDRKATKPWFDKMRNDWDYRQGGGNELPDSRVLPNAPKSLHRYGTQELYDVSQKLRQMNLPEGKSATAPEVNKLLKSHGANVGSEYGNVIGKPSE